MAATSKTFESDEFADNLRHSKRISISLIPTNLPWSEDGRNVQYWRCSSGELRWTKNDGQRRWRSLWHPDSLVLLVRRNKEDRKHLPARRSQEGLTLIASFSLTVPAN